MRLYKISEKGELIKLNKLPFDENDVYLVDDKEKNTIYIWVGLNVQQGTKDITADIARKLDKERGGSTKILIMKEKREYGSFLAMMHNLERGLIPGKTVERRPEFVFEVPSKNIKTVKLDGTPEEREIKVETRIVDWLQQIKEHRKSDLKQEIKEIPKAAKFVRLETPSTEIKPKEIIPANIVAPKEEIIEEVEELDFESQIREAAYYLSLKNYTYNELCWILAEKIQKINLELPSIEDIRRKAEDVFNSSCTYDELCWLNAEIDILLKKSFIEQKKRKMFDY